LNSRKFNDFLLFFKLCNEVVSAKKRIWVIIDEVVEFEKSYLNFYLPEEQKFSNFYFIVTGSAGICSWISKRHLDKWVFDLPFFSRNESFQYAEGLREKLGIEKTLSEIIDIPIATDNSATETLFEIVDIPTTSDNSASPFNAASVWLDETFGGIPGYIAEFLMEVKAGNGFYILF
jgi:hypothetical protein